MKSGNKKIIEKLTGKSFDDLMLTPGSKNWLTEQEKVTRALTDALAAYISFHNAKNQIQ